MEQLNIFSYILPQYKITKPIRLIELFAGIGSQAKALKNLGVNFEHYRVVEWDKYAINSYNSVHGTTFTTSDIAKIKGSDLGIVDTRLYDYILTYSFPCQDISLAGKMGGMSKGTNTRSGLLWEVERLLDECTELPQILLMENVPQIISQQNIADFQDWQYKLEQLGYSNYVSLLNAKDYGIPQNRKRCFMVSIQGNYAYRFPSPKKLELKLHDLLEDEVDEKYFLSEEGIKAALNTTYECGKLEKRLAKDGIIPTLCAREYRGSKLIEVFDFRYDEGFRGRVEKDLSPTLTLKVESSGISGQPLLKVPENTKKGYAEAEVGDGIYINRPHQKRGTVQKGMIQTIKSSVNDLGVVVDTAESLRIRKLTPLESWRLMGFNDEDFEKASKVNSNTQLYKQAGNSIVVNVLMAIFKELL